MVWRNWQRDVSERGTLLASHDVGQIERWLSVSGKIWAWRNRRALWMDHQFHLLRTWPGARLLWWERQEFCSSCTRETINLLGFLTQPKRDTRRLREQQRRGVRDGARVGIWLFFTCWLIVWSCPQPLSRFPWASVSPSVTRGRGLAQSSLKSPASSNMPQFPCPKQPLPMTVQSAASSQRQSSWHWANPPWSRTQNGKVQTSGSQI